MSTPAGDGGPAYALMLDLGDSVAEAVEAARRAETAGLDAVYAIEGFREPFVPLAAMAAATERIRLGTYVVNAYARTPAAAASAALDLDELSGGRFTFGIGAGNRHINDWWHGADSSRPLDKLRQYLAVVRALIRAQAGERVEVDGSIHRVRARAAREPVGRIPIVVAAAGPRMIELAATASDGVGVGILVSPEHLANEIRPRARAAAEAAGADPAALRFPMAAMVTVDEDVERGPGAGPAVDLPAVPPRPPPLLRLPAAGPGLRVGRRCGRRAGSPKALGRGDGAHRRRAGRPLDDHRHRSAVRGAAGGLPRPRHEVICLSYRTRPGEGPEDLYGGVFDLVALARGGAAARVGGVAAPGRDGGEAGR